MFPDQESTVVEMHCKEVRRKIVEYLTEILTWKRLPESMRIWSTATTAQRSMMAFGILLIYWPQKRLSNSQPDSAIDSLTA